MTAFALLRRTATGIGSVVSGSSFRHPRAGDLPDVEARVAWQPSVLAIGGYDGQFAFASSNELGVCAWFGFRAVSLNA